jgi:hypothetical protein
MPGIHARTIAIDESNWRLPDRCVRPRCHDHPHRRMLEGMR